MKHKAYDQSDVPSQRELVEVRAEDLQIGDMIQVDSLRNQIIATVGTVDHISSGLFAGCTRVSLGDGATFYLTNEALVKVFAKPISYVPRHLTFKMK